MTEIEVKYEGDLTTLCLHKESGKTFQTNAPKDVPGGKGEAFSPTDLVGTGLGACALTLIAMKAAQLKVDVKGARVVVFKEMMSQPIRRLKKLNLTFYIPKMPSLEIQEALIKAAKTCPVHESLHPDVIQEFVFIWT